LQHYRCLSCNKQFQNKRRPQKLEKKIWNEHVWKRQTISDLQERFKKGRNWVKKILDKAETRKGLDISPQEIIGIFDATHIGEDLLLTAREPNLGVNLAWSWIESENKESYAELKRNIEARGFVFLGVVLDGRTGIPRVFDGIPVQICQFHQLKIIQRKLTLRPETEAGQTLLSIGLTITKKTEKMLFKELIDWYEKYQNFINEKIHILGTRRWRYTHRRVRSAYLSLKRNLPYLYTYQKYPELNIPNTTNSLDGYWGRLKNLLSAHRGKTKERMKKIATEILRKQTA
jgi:hypothetical protein